MYTWNRVIGSSPITTALKYITRPHLPRIIKQDSQYEYGIIFAYCIFHAILSSLYFGKPALPVSVPGDVVITVSADYVPEYRLEPFSNDRAGHRLRFFIPKASVRTDDIQRVALSRVLMFFSSQKLSIVATHDL